MALTPHSRNMAYIFAGNMGGRFLGFIATAYLARVLGRAGFGEINIGLAVLNYALLFSNSGLSLLGTQKIAAGGIDAPAFTGRLLLTRVWLSLLVYAPFTAATWWILYPEQQIIAQLITIYLLFLFPAACWLDWFFQGQRQMGSIAIGTLLHMAVYLLVVLLGVRDRGDILLPAWGWTLGALANALTLWWLFKRRSFSLHWPSLPQFRPFQLWQRALPLGLATLISQIVLQFPVLYLGWFADTTAVGDFSAAFRMVAFLLILDRIFYSVFFPSISRRAYQTPQQLDTLVNRILKLVSVAALVIGLLAVFSAGEVIPLIFGPAYAPAVPLFQAMAGYFVFTLINSVIGYTLLGMGHHRLFTRAFWIGLAVFFVAIFTLSPPLNLLGVVSALTLYQFTALIAMTGYLRRYLAVQPLRSFILPTIGTFCLLLPLLLWVAWPLPWNMLLIVMVGIPLISWWAGLGRGDLLFAKRMLF